LGVWVEIGFAGLGLALLGFAVWELISLRREQRQSHHDDDEPGAED
jgi:hypothetical protein